MLWLEINGKTDRAEKILQKAAKMNKIALPNPLSARKSRNKISKLIKIEKAPVSIACYLHSRRIASLMRVRTEIKTEPFTASNTFSAAK